MKIRKKPCIKCGDMIEYKSNKTIHCKSCKKIQLREYQRNWYHKKSGKKLTHKNLFNENTNTYTTINNIKNYSYIKGILTRGGLDQIDIFKIINIYCDYYDVSYYRKNINITDILFQLKDKLEKKDKKIVKIDKNGCKT